MADYYHENVVREGSLPALMGTLGKKEITQFFPKDVFIPAHWHRSLEISLIENAEVIVQIGKKEMNIKDDFTCINSGVVHSLKGKSMSDDVHCFIVVLSYDFMRQYYPNIDQIVFDLSLKEDHSDLKSIYKRLEELYSHQDCYSYLEITACLLELFGLLLRDYKKNKPLKKIKSERTQEEVKNVLTYVHEHYQEELTLSYMAEMFYMSKEHFSRQFHYYVGNTFKDYLSSYRLYMAYEDVIKTDYTIQDIASKHGFVNVKSFIKAFRDMYHQTPLQYRKDYQEKL